LWEGVGEGAVGGGGTWRALALAATLWRARRSAVFFLRSWGEVSELEDGGRGGGNGMHIAGTVFCWVTVHDKIYSHDVVLSVVGTLSHHIARSLGRTSRVSPPLTVGMCCVWLLRGEAGWWLMIARSNRGSMICKRQGCFIELHFTINRLLWGCYGTLTLYCYYTIYKRRGKRRRE